MFVARYPQCYLVTWTFKENVTEKKEAMRRWKPVRDYLVRQGVDFVGVWQRQKRGAWHFHALVNLRLNVVTLRSFCVQRGWGSQLNIELIGGGARRFTDGPAAVKYLCRYLTRDFGEVGRSRLTTGLDKNSIGNTRFAWAGGRARIWRIGLSVFDFEESRKRWVKRGEKLRAWSVWRVKEDVMLAACAHLKLSGLDILRLGLDSCIGWARAPALGS